MPPRDSVIINAHITIVGPPDADHLVIVELEPTVIHPNFEHLVPPPQKFRRILSRFVR